MLHNKAIPSGEPVTKDLYYTLLQNGEIANQINPHNCRIFETFSSWSPEQLRFEIERGIWILADCPQEVLFDVQENGQLDLSDKDRTKKSSDLWKKVLRLMGGEYAIFSYVGEPERQIQE